MKSKQSCACYITDKDLDLKPNYFSLFYKGFTSILVQELCRKESIRMSGKPAK